MASEVSDKDTEIVHGEIGEDLKFLPRILPAFATAKFYKPPIHHAHIVTASAACVARHGASPLQPDFIWNKIKVFVLRLERITLG